MGERTHAAEAPGEEGRTPPRARPWAAHLRRAGMAIALLATLAVAARIYHYERTCYLVRWADGVVSASPDGRTVVFDMEVDECPGVFAVDVATKHLRPLHWGGPTGSVAWHPSGSHVGFAEGGEAVAVDVRGRGQPRTYHRGSLSGVAWSPSGDELLGLSRNPAGAAWCVSWPGGGYSDIPPEPGRTRSAWWAGQTASTLQEVVSLSMDRAAGQPPETEFPRYDHLSLKVHGISYVDDRTLIDTPGTWYGDATRDAAPLETFTCAGWYAFYVDAVGMWAPTGSEPAEHGRPGRIVRVHVETGKVVEADLGAEHLEAIPKPGRITHVLPSPRGERVAVIVGRGDYQVMPPAGETTVSLLTYEKGGPTQRLLATIPWEKSSLASAYAWSPSGTRLLVQDLETPRTVIDVPGGGTHVLRRGADDLGENVCWLDDDRLVTLVDDRDRNGVYIQEVDSGAIELLVRTGPFGGPDPDEPGLLAGWLQRLKDLLHP
jgi:hypothetical protein